MDIGTVTQLIGSLGFPIAACIYMAYINKESDHQHREEVKELSKAIENNTQVMIRIEERLEAMK